MLKLVIIESPYAPWSKDPRIGYVQLKRNEAYLNACLSDAFARGEIPFASHGLYTRPGVLDDSKPEERKKGMQAGFDMAQALWVAAKYTQGSAIVTPQFEFCRAFYIDRGWSSGMVDGIVSAVEAKQPWEKRSLGLGWSREFDDEWATSPEGLLVPLTKRAA